ncbi:MAG: response regulator [Bacteroidales bacterium]|nr:response regulator [Bacteroidales bacterium]
MKHVTGREIVNRIDRYLADPRLEPEALLRKRWAWIWMVVTFVFVLITAFFELVILKAWPIWWVGAAFGVSYLIGFPVFRRSKRFDLVINIVFSIFIIVVFFAMLQIGGLTTSMGFVFVGLNCAMGSVLAGNLRWTIGMFILYCSTILFVGILQPYLTTPDYITPAVNTITFVGLALWINACILFLVILFMKDKNRYEKAEAEKVRKIDEAKTLLYTNVSHEFRTPLTIIQGMAEQMEQHPDKWLKTGPGKIKVQSQVLLRLVNQMLDISKIEAESMPLDLIHGDIRKYVQYVAGSFHSLAENRDIRLQVDLNDKPIYTDYDPEKLMLVLSNLMSNAIKFTAPGGHISVDVSGTIEKKEEKIEIHVRDSGKGIPQEAIGRIFDRFYQVPDKNDQTPGTGLGLALTRELVKLMKGNISVTSEVGTGTEFIIMLPVTRNAMVEEDNGISMVHSEPINSFIQMPERGKEPDFHSAILSEKPILLIVEDNMDVVEYLISILEDHYMIELASNGKAGFEKASEIIPDIILTDVMMPQMDGFELLRHLKDDIRTDHIPVVVLTARGDLQSKLTGLEIGADHYLVKPFSEKELFLKLNNLLELRRKMQQKLRSMPSPLYHGNTQYRYELQFLSRINSLLDDQLQNEDFGIKDICSNLNMSRPQLYRKFTALTKRSVGRYIRSYRLHKAKEKIESQGKNVTEAAYESGFKNLSHFSTSFREEFGYPPSDLL